MRRTFLITLLTLGLLVPFESMVLNKTSAQNRSDEAQIRQFKQKLQEPVPTANQPAARDALAKQQAEAAAALLKLGQDGRRLWTLLRHSSDDSRRTYLIHSLARSGVNPSVIKQS